ncbi:MAG: hypothetical protein ACP6IS_07880 [Candidatus Asgardarchaeia archaeon]
MIQELKDYLGIEDSTRISQLLEDLENKDIMIELAEHFIYSGKNHLAENILNQLLLLNLGNEQSAELWNMIRGLRHIIRVIKPFAGDITPKWSPNGKYFAFTCQDLICVMKQKNWQILRFGELHTASYDYLRWIDNRFIFIPLARGNVAIFDVALGNVIKKDVSLPPGITEFSPTGRFFIRRLKKNHTVIWDIINGKMLLDLGYRYRYHYLSGIWSPISECLIFQKGPYEGIVFDPIKDEIIKKIKLPEKYITELKWSNDEKLIAMKGFSRRHIYIYDFADDKVIATINGKKDEFRGIAYFHFYDKGNKIVFRNRKKKLIVVDIKTKKKRKGIGYVNNFSLDSNSGLAVIFDNEYEKNIKIYDLSAAKEINKLSEKNYFIEKVYTIDVSHDNRYIAIGSLNASVKVFDNNTMSFIISEDFPIIFYAKSVSWSPRSPLLSILYESKGKVGYLNYDFLEKRSFLFPLPKENQTYYRTIIEKGQRIKWSPTGRHMAITATNERILIFQVTPVYEVRDLWHTGSVSNIAWNHDENVICSVTLSGAIKIWNNYVPAFERRKKGIELYGLVWDDKNKQFITTGTNGYIGFIKEQQDNTFEIIDETKLDEKNTLFSLEIVPDYDMIIAGDNKGTLHIISLENISDVKTFKVGYNPVSEIKYAPAEKYLYAVTYMEKVVGVPLEKLLEKSM